MKSGKALFASIIVLGIFGVLALIILAQSQGINISLMDAIFGDKHSVKITKKSAEITPITKPLEENKSLKNEKIDKPQKSTSEKNTTINLPIKKDTIKIQKLSLEKLIKSFNANPKYWNDNPATFTKIEEDINNHQLTVLINFLDGRNMIYTYELDDSFSKIIKKINPKPKHIVNINNWEDTWKDNLIVYFPEERIIDTPNKQFQLPTPKLSKNNEDYTDESSIKNTYGYIYTKEGQFFITHYSYYTTVNKNYKNPTWIYKIEN